MAGSTAAAAAMRFTVHRRPAVLVAPATPTPRELKLLSNIDDIGSFRFHIPVILLYKRNESMGDRDPAPVIRDALARALTYYYPLAGRLREVEGGKLAVDCTGDGVLFTEADADVRLDDFPQPLLPPFPCSEELIFDVPGSSAVVDAPILLFQMTRLACGGFILAVRTNHTMADAFGLVQFLDAIAELARGASTPKVRPVWRRELLMARDPPRPSFAHRELDEATPGTEADDFLISSLHNHDLAHRCFFFDHSCIAVLRGHLEPHLRSRATTFDLLAGSLWKCRTMALALLAPVDAANIEMRLMFAINFHGVKNPGPVPAGSSSSIPLPSGYYGNAAIPVVAVSATGEICTRPVSYAVELVNKAKEEAVNMEYIRSFADLIGLRGRAPMSLSHTYVVSDLRKVPFADLDFGWDKPVYAGATQSGGAVPIVASFFVAVRNEKGELGIAVPVCLPAKAMDRFVEEMGKLLRRPLVDIVPRHKPRSAL